MPGIEIVDGATRVAVTALDGLALRQSVIGNNLANLNTPNFKAADVTFARALDQAVAAAEPKAPNAIGAPLALSQTAEGHLPGMSPLSPKVGPEIVTREGTTHRLDGNNVDAEKEMADLTETMLHYQTATRVVTRRLAGMRTVINEGRR